MKYIIVTVGSLGSHLHLTLHFTQTKTIKVEVMEAIGIRAFKIKLRDRPV